MQRDVSFQLALLKVLSFTLKILRQQQCNELSRVGISGRSIEVDGGQSSTLWHTENILNLDHKSNDTYSWVLCLCTYDWPLSYAISLGSLVVWSVNNTNYKHSHKLHGATATMALGWWVRYTGAMANSAVNRPLLEFVLSGNVCVLTISVPV